MTATCIALGYIGPGGVLSAIGSFVALLAAAVLAAIGFVWYPIKRVLSAIRRRPQREPARSPEP